MKGVVRVVEKEKEDLGGIGREKACEILLIRVTRDTYLACPERVVGADLAPDKF